MIKYVGIDIMNVNKKTDEVKYKLTLDKDGKEESSMLTVAPLKDEYAIEIYGKYGVSWEFDAMVDDFIKERKDA